MGLCRDCHHFLPEREDGFGSCQRWETGYGEVNLLPNEVLVEDDEGWGMMMGPEFGCVLFEPKS